MSNDPLTLGSVDPYKLAAQHRSLQGALVVANMDRVVKLLAATAGMLAYDVSFTFDEDKLCVVSGDLSVELQLCCQRCLQTFAYSVVSNFVVSPVLIDQAAQLSTTYEPVMLEDGKINLQELLEDELILALPQVPMHDLDNATHAKQCKQIEIKDDMAQDLANPFQILRELKLSKTGPKTDGQ